MPGNGVGDRAHNSFDQENLSQGQQHFKATEKNWPGLSNDIWVGSQTQNGFPLGSNLKNYNLPQSANIDGGHGITSFQVANGLNSAQPHLRSELAGSQFQNQPAAFNGFIQGHTAGRQYEANFLGLDANSYQNNVTSKGLSLLESHRGNAPDLQKKDFARFLHVQQAPVSFNSFGGQEQMGGQHPGHLQSLQRQQSGINDVQLLHQQMILRQLHDSQKQQFQHQGVWHQNSPINLLSAMASQAAANHSPALNGIPVHDPPNKSWPELLANNPNRPHLGASAIMQGSPGGFELPSEQSQALRNMGLVLQQSDQSLYGVPMAGARDSLSQTSHTQNEMSSFGNSFLRNQDAAPAGQDNKDRHLVSRQEFSGKQELTGFSDSAQAKTSSTATHPHNVATLDPAEEKILFGSDDNLWEAFGGEMSTGVGGLNMSDGSGLFPSLQSGSWSALMQSALAETSSVETGQQEEWTGLSYPSTEPTTGRQQSSAFNGGPKHDQQPTWTESSMLAGSSFPVAAGHQLDRKVSQERREDLRTESSPRYMQDSSQVNRHLEPSPLAKSTTEGSQIFGRVDNSSIVDRKQYTSGSWTHQQSMSSFDARAQLNDRSNGWNMIDSGVSGEAPSLKINGSEMFVQPSQDSTHNRQAQEFHGAPTGRTDVFHSLAVGSEQSKALGGTTLHRQDSSSSNAAVNPSSSKVVPESTHWLQDSQRFNFWRQVDPSANSRGSEGLGKTHHLDKNSKMLESSGNDDMREVHNSRKRENSSGSFPSNLSRHGSPGVVQENSTDGSDYRSLHGSKGNSSGRAVQKPVGFPKFHYHPMGDLEADGDNSRGSKAGASPQTAFQQGFNKFSSVGGSGGSLSMNKSAQSSQNMLELLHKLDQSKERDAASHMSSSDRNDAHEAETSDGSVGQLQRNQSPRSQGFGLQLAPPSQRLQHPDHAVGSQSSSQIPNSRISSDRSEFGHMPFVSAPSNRPMSSWKEKSEGENRNQISGASEQDDDRSSIGFNSGFPFSRSHPEIQRDAGRALPGQLFNSALHRLASHSKAKETSSEGIQSSQSPAAPDFSASTSLGSNVSATERVQTGPPVYTGSLPQHNQVSDAAAMGSPSLTVGVPQHGVFSRGLSSSFLGSTSPSLMRPSVQSNDNDMQRGVGGAMELSSNVSFNPPESPRTAEAAQNSLQGKVSSANHVPDASLPGSVSDSTQRQQNYSLLHQMQAMKSFNVDPSDRILKRFRALDSGVDSQAVRMGENQVSQGHSAAAGDVSVVNPFTGGDSNAFNLSGKQSNNWNASPASLQMDVLRSGSAHSSRNYEGPFRHDNTQVHPQMAPSWVGQSGTLKDGQVLQVPDAQKMAAVKHMEQAHPVEKPADNLRDHEQFHADSDASPVNSSYSWLPTSMRAEDISSQHTLPPEATDQSLLMKQKKRKIPVPEVQAWHKEVMNSGKLHSASTTEIEWARAANRLIQKIEDETEEDGLTSLRPKKRLILSTHLMQQLLRPPPAPFLAGDAKSHYENVTYCVSKSALGDACRAVHFSSNKPSVPDSSEKTSLEKPKNPERSGSEKIVKAAEDLLGRANKLEKELLRLDQRSSMVDLRVELQDLERFAIINRFAKFHGRSPSDASGGPSSDPTAHASRPLLQRYVMALPMPRNIPDSVQCLSL